MFGNQEPDATQGSRNLVGQELPYTPFKVSGVAQFQTHLIFGPMGFDLDRSVSGPTEMEFFFEGHIPQ